MPGVALDNVSQAQCSTGSAGLASGHHLYWVSVHEPNNGGLDPDQAIDRDHLEQSKRTKEPGWVEAEPQVLMLPDPIRKAVLDWALRLGTSAHHD